MYELQGQKFTLNELQNYASNKGMEFDDFMSSMRNAGLVELSGKQGQSNFFANNAILGGKIIDFFANNIPEYIAQATPGKDVQVSFEFAEDEDKDYSAMVDVIKSQVEKPPSEAMKNFYKILEENGGGPIGVIKAFRENPGIAPEVLVTSLASAVSAGVFSGKARKYAAIGGAAGVKAGKGRGERCCVCARYLRLHGWKEN